VRDDLDWDEAAELVEDMRAAIREEWRISFGKGTQGRPEAAAEKDAQEADVPGVGAAEHGGVNRRGAWKV
jgi:hypothetical protein